MGKSLGNFINLHEFFHWKSRTFGTTIYSNDSTFFILQTHYRSVLDFSNDALLASEKGLIRLIKCC